MRINTQAGQKLKLEISPVKTKSVTIDVAKDHDTDDRCHECDDGKTD